MIVGVRTWFDYFRSSSTVTPLHVVAPLRCHLNFANALEMQGLFASQGKWTQELLTSL